MNKENKKSQAIFFIVLFLFLLYGCSGSVTQSIETNIPVVSTNKLNLTTPTILPTSTLEFIVVLPINPTIYPTVSMNQEAKIYSLLNTKNCVLPCYMGITPGITTWNEAKQILKETGAYLSWPDEIKDDIHHYSFVLPIGDQP